MYFWNLTIDTVTCIQLVLAIGLAVDYSAHIGHSYMTVTGDRNGMRFTVHPIEIICKDMELSHLILLFIFTVRTVKTMSLIGPAVFNGGFSTFLAFVLLASSNSYVFDVFFKVGIAGNLRFLFYYILSE